MTKEQKSAEEIDKLADEAWCNAYIIDKTKWDLFSEAFKAGYTKALKDRECDRCELLLKALESTNAIVWPDTSTINKMADEWEAEDLEGYRDAWQFIDTIKYLKQRMNREK